MTVRPAWRRLHEGARVPIRRCSPRAGRSAALYLLPLRSSPPCPPIISVSNLSKTYGSGFKALNGINLDIRRGEIFALLGPNGAGKTTLISIICGIANPSDGHRHRSTATTSSRDYRAARSLIGLVPQELHTDAFETVWATVSFSRGLFGKPKNPAHIEKVLKDLSLWDKKDNKIITLSGGMKRRVMIAKALSHEPQILFLDEPTAGVDVELRKDMWEVVRDAAGLRRHHHPDHALHRRGRGDGRPDRRHQQGRDHPGRGQGRADAEARQEAADAASAGQDRCDSRRRSPPTTSNCRDDGSELIYTYDTKGERTGITSLLSDLRDAGIRFYDLDTTQSSLEDIFVSLVRAP